MREESGSLPAGVSTLDHTADVGLRIEADSLAQLFHRAGRGMLALVGEPADGEAAAERATVGPPPAGMEARRADRASERVLELEADDVATLLLRWLREILYVYVVDGFAYRSASFERLDATGLRARLTGASRRTGSGELKAVTYHGLEATERPDGGWRAQIIFDV